MESLTEDQVVSIRNVFDHYDKGDGTIGAKQLQKVFRKFGAKATEAEVEDMVKDAGGSIDLKEFTFLMGRKMRDCDVQAELSAAFDEMDHDQDGYISVEDVERSFLTTGESLLPEELREVMREIDASNTGKVSKAQFVKLMLV